jgi:hypothetical protein
MALTSANAVAILQDRVGDLMVFVGKTADAAGMASALSWACRKQGVTVDDYTAVTDSEIAAATDADDFLDLAEYRLLADVLGNLDVVDVTGGPRSEKLSQVANYIRQRMSSLEASGILELTEPLEYHHIELNVAAEDSA